jgi:hypothetical protein
MIGCVFITIAGSKAAELTGALPIVLFGHFQKKLNFISLEDRHGVASLQTLNQSSLAFPSPFEGKVPMEVNKLLTVYYLLSLP